MEEGVLQGGGSRGVGWLDQPSAFPGRFNMEMLGVTTWKYAYVPAVRCPACRKIIVSY